ncbi:unnamed protein product [Prunus armeniaca]
MDALFNEMLLHKAIETPHRLAKPEELKGRQYCRWYNSWNHSTSSCVVFRDVIQEGITAGRLKLAEKPPTITTDPFPQPQVNMVNLKKLIKGQRQLAKEQKRGKLAKEASTSRGGRVTREANQRPKATISSGVVLCNKCKCESELEITLDRQKRPTPSVFDRIGTLYPQAPIPALSKYRARHKDYLRHAQHSRRETKHPKKEIPIKMPRNGKPLTTIIEGR